MKLFKWLFHPVLLLLVIAAIILYLNREQVREHFADNRSVIRVIDHSERVVALLSRGVGELLPEPKPSRSRVADEAPAADTGAKADASSGEEGAWRADEGDRMEGPGSVVFVDEGTREGDASDFRPEPAAQAASTDVAPALWYDARKAAWFGRLDESVRLYRQLVEQQPDNYDLYGEMANVLLQMGDQEGAVDSYAIAARLAKAQQRMDVAMHTLQVVQQIDSERARWLNGELSD